MDVSVALPRTELSTAVLAPPVRCSAIFFVIAEGSPVDPADGRRVA